MNALEATFGPEAPIAKWIGPPEAWKPWQTFLKALTATPLTEEEKPLFSKCTGRTAEFPKPVQEAWVVVGRRGRKSAVAAILGVHAAVFRDWSPCLAPGESGRVLLVACDKDQARIVRNYCEAILSSHPTLAALIESSDKESITLTNGIEIICVANSFRSIRGRAVVCAIFEELAYWRSDESAVPDKEVLRAVKPSMLTTAKHGALLIGISSPYAKRGLLYEKHKEHFGNNGSSVLVWQADTLTMNPDADADEIAAAYKDDPVAAASEYGAMFRDDIATFLDPDLLATLTRPSPLELPPLTGTRYYGFVDPSGGRGDAFTVAISHRDKEKNVLDFVRSVSAPFDPQVVTKNFAALLKQYHLFEVVGDAYSGEWVREAFKEQNIIYRVSKIFKSQIYLESLPLFTRGEVVIPDHRPLLVELGQLERRTARGGKDSVDHPRGCHDDQANAACGALHLASQARIFNGRCPGPVGDWALSVHNIGESTGGDPCSLGGYD